MIIMCRSVFNPLLISSVSLSILPTAPGINFASTDLAKRQVIRLEYIILDGRRLRFSRHCESTGVMPELAIARTLSAPASAPGPVSADGEESMKFAGTPVFVQNQTAMSTGKVGTFSISD